MDYNLKISKIAKNDIKNAINYYIKISKKTSNNFFDDYQNTIKNILINPYFKLFYKNFRGKSLKKFPFIVFYTIDEKNKLIIIKAVFHTSQNTEKYPKI